MKKIVIYKDQLNNFKLSDDCIMELEKSQEMLQDVVLLEKRIGESM